MAAKYPVLILYGRRVPSVKGLAIEALAEGLKQTLPLADGKKPSLLRGILNRNSYESLSYVNDWLDAFQSSPDLAVRSLNIANLVDLVSARRLVSTYPSVVILHSAAGDDMAVMGMLGKALQSRAGKLLVFFGNEYSKMPDKIRFAKTVGADFIASQLPMDAAKWLYRDCEGSKIIHSPAALNPRRYMALNLERDIDLCFRGDKYPMSIGDIERTKIIEMVKKHAPSFGLRTDIKFARYPANLWRVFLNRSHGIVGAEAGTAYLEDFEETENNITSFLASNSEASFADVHDKFFANRKSAVSGKAISSRHFESIGTKTCQILLEGNYNGILTPNEHYLSLDRDYGNLEEVLTQFCDPQIRAAITESAFEHVSSSHTYDQRVRKIAEMIAR